MDFRSVVGSVTVLQPPDFVAISIYTSQGDGVEYSDKTSLFESKYLEAVSASAR